MKPWLLSHQSILSKQFSHATLPHAILINGVTGSGKLELAKWLIQLLNCSQPIGAVEHDKGNTRGCGYCKSCLLLQSHTFPDHLNVVPQKNSLGVDDIRYANSFLQKTAYLGHFKTVLIDNAETMTIAAMNALLKTLEEPSDKSIIILLTNDINSLLPTLISRCSVLNIRPAVGEELLLQLKANNIEDKLNVVEGENLSDNTFINLTQLPELTDAKIKEAFIAFRKCYISYLRLHQGESQLLQHLLTNEHALRWLEQITVNLLRENLLDESKNEHIKSLDAELLNSVYKAIIYGCKLIKSYTQANSQFVCEQVIMNISDLVEQNINQKSNDKPL